MKNKRGLKKEKKFSLKEQYRLSWNYLRESKNFIFVIVALFLISALLGFFVSPPAEISEQLLNYLNELLSKTTGLSAFGLIKFIFLNNFQSSFFTMMFGFILGIVPVIGTLMNGYVLGFVSVRAVETGGFGILLNLLPHGIFELPAIFISLGLGLKFGTFVFKKNSCEVFKKFLINSLRVFVFAVLPLLVIAAIIEGLLIALA